MTYLLPAFPAFGWLAARAWRAAPKRPSFAVAAVALGVIPLSLVVGRPLVLRHAERESGAALARAVRATGGGTVRYERCYSPGTDYLLGRSGVVLSDLGYEITSNYILRYRESLKSRGLWTLHPEGEAPEADVVVQSPRRHPAPPAGDWRLIFESSRFVAWRRAGAER